MILLKNVASISIPLKSGWLPDPEKSDWTFAQTPLAKNEVLVHTYDLSPYFLPVSDQMHFPSCTANAGADLWEAECVIEKVNEGNCTLAQAKNSVPNLSRMFLWYNGRMLMDPQQQNNPNSGCYNRLIMDSIARFGVVPESLWPYTEANATTRPSLMAYREAMKNRSAEFYSINEPLGQPRKDALLRTLAAKHPIMFGTDLGPMFSVYDATSPPLSSPTVKLVRHAMVIVGYNADHNLWLVRNSHSPYWGKNGYCYMTDEYITQYPGTGALWFATKAALS